MDIFELLDVQLHFTTNHIFNLPDILIELNRVMRINGYILLTVPFVWNVKKKTITLNVKVVVSNSSNFICASTDYAPDSTVCSKWAA